MNAEIIAVGTEILLGDIVNTNAQYIARGLKELGINVFFQSVIGDNKERLEEALEAAKQRSDLILLTGGLGPTYDDLTKETVAKSFGKTLEMNEEYAAWLKDYFSQISRTMTENNMKQIYFPKDAKIFPNDRGTAPGCAFGDENTTAIMLPGPPKEMTYMFDTYVKPYLMEKNHETIVTRTMNIFGMGESTVETKLKDIMERSTNPTVAPYAKEAFVTLSVTAKAKTKEEAFDMTVSIVEEISERLGDVIYGIDCGNLENRVFEMLKEKKKTIAFAESCTGGLIAEKMTSIPGASEVFHFGAVTYSNEAKMRILGVSEKTLAEYGAVSKKCAAEMALGARKISGADIAVSVTGIAGPDGGTTEKPVGLSFIAISTENGILVKKVMSGGNRIRVREYAANYALDMARRYLEKGI